MATRIRVVVRKKSKWQKKDCLFCDGKARKEAFATNGNRSAQIRCCGKKDCIAAAKDCARDAFRKPGKKLWS